jgi:hypothetical protein
MDDHVEEAFHKYSTELQNLRWPHWLLSWYLIFCELPKAILSSVYPKDKPSPPDFKQKLPANLAPNHPLPYIAFCNSPHLERKEAP